MKCIAVIPARYASTRLPGKALLPLGEKPIIQHVYERVRQVPGIDTVLVATDDERILNRVTSFGGQACMTGTHHLSGSDRIAEAIATRPCDWVFNIQGDEPFIDLTTVQAVLREAVSRNLSPVYTASVPIRSLEDWVNPSVVKVIVNQKNQALYFSRWPIPYQRNVLANDLISVFREKCQEKLDLGLHQRHLGIYLYRREFLLEYVQMPPGPLELAEHLEQLRILEHGYTISVVPASQSGISIDTPKDYEDAKRYYEQNFRGSK